MSGFQRLIGLTGSIGTGKTTVSRYLADVYQLPILDADLYAREAVQPGSPILATIFCRYGSSVQMPDRTLNRQRLGEIIFNDAEEKRWLEQQIHPFVRDRFLSELQQLAEPTIVLAIPLLFEAQMTDLVTEIWVVYCSFEEQVKRLKQRDCLNRQQAIARIHSQLPIDTKMAAADVVLDNSSSLESLYRQIDQSFKPAKS
ncbi:MAG: dephospho-CoA kinase [Cyanophyceae cyanobacterium]